MKNNSPQRKPALLMSLLSIATFHSAAALVTTPTLQLPTVPNSFDIVYKLKPYTALPAIQYNAQVALSGLTTSTSSTKKFGTTTYIVSAQNPTNFFNFDTATGALSFSRDLRKYEGDFAPTLPKTNDEAKTVAIDYLTTNKLLPAIAAGDSMVLASVQTITATRPPTPPLQGNVSIDKLKVVTFRREIYGIPVMGPGSKIVVTIGDKNVVEGLIHRWRPFIAPAKPPITGTAAASAPKTTTVPKVKTVVPTVPSITPEESLVALKARLQKKFPDSSALEINSMIRFMDVGLYDSNVVAIQPVYVFQADFNRKSDLPLQGTDHQELFLTASPFLKTPPEAIYQLGDVTPSPLPKTAVED
jgi:hypothetical protein